MLEAWSNVGVVLAPGTEAAGCFSALLSPVHTASSHTIFEQPSPLLLPAYSDGWDEILNICSFFLIFSLLALGLNWQSEPQKFILPFHPPFPLKFPLLEWAIVTDAFKLHCSLYKQRADIWHILKLLYWIVMVPVNRLHVCHSSAAVNGWIPSCMDWGVPSPVVATGWRADVLRAGPVEEWERAHTLTNTLVLQCWLESESQQVVKWINKNGRHKVLLEFRNESVLGEALFW